MKLFDGFTVVILFLVFLCERFKLNSAISTPCALRPSAHGSVCVCNATYCDYLDPVSPKGENGFVLTSSSNVGLRFSTKLAQFSDKRILVKDWTQSNTGKGNTSKTSSMQSIASAQKAKIYIDRSKKYQKIVGFGGAFTGAVSHNLQFIPQELQDAVYKSYFSKNGIAYNIIRMAIGGSDFDLKPWAYNELPENDTNLSNFTKLNDLDEKKIEQIKRLQTVTNVKDLKIMGAAWSPPKWMKTVHSWNGMSFLEQKYYQTWADYHLRFIELMEAKNMPIWAISTGNEPMNAYFYESFIKFLSLGWTPSSQANWVADNLGPTIRNSKFKDVKIFGNDDQRYTFPVWYKIMNRTRKESIDYLDGLAVHWYWDDKYGIDLIDQTHGVMPDKMILNTESCLDSSFGGIVGPALGSWERAEKYATSYLIDLQHSFNGYIDWNIALDEQGGPNYVGNLVDTPIVINVTSGQEIYKQPMFYAIGHFSKYIPEGSIRIEAECSTKNITTVAFERPDGSISCIFINSAQAEAVVTLADSIRGNIEISIPPKSLHTIEYN